MQKGGKEKLAQLSRDKSSQKACRWPRDNYRQGFNKPCVGRQGCTDGYHIHLCARCRGPESSLAVMRKPAKDLPIQFVLDDSTAMQQQMAISNFDQVVVLARVSKSGNATPQSAIWKA